MRVLFHPARDDIALPNILYALSDPLRLRIVAQLADAAAELSCGDFSVGDDVAKSTQSHHLKVLREAGLTRATPRGTRLMIALRRADLDTRFPGLLDATLQAYHATMRGEASMTVTELTYEAIIEAWRAQAEANLRADAGWLTLAGLFWLDEGVNRFGSDLANDIVLPADLPGTIGSFNYYEGQVTLEIASDVDVKVNGKRASAQVLRSSADGTPDLITIGELTLFVHRSGARHAIRLRDKNNPARREFAGRRWFPIREKYCISATFVPYDPPKLLAIPNVVGDTNQVYSPGYVAFTIDGQEQRLDASAWRDDGGLLLHFHDLIGGQATYPGGRFLSTTPPVHGRVTLDFNQAVSPPCAFTPFATCPLILPQNKLAVRIPAGELWHASH